METFQEAAFLYRLNEARQSIGKILKTTRSPVLPSNTPHTYLDKYLLVEFLANSSCAAIINSYESLGIDANMLQELKEWSATRSVTLRFVAEETCSFLRKKERMVKASSSSNFDYSARGIVSRLTSRVVTKITEYFYKFSSSYKLIAFRGNDLDSAITLFSGGGSTTLIEQTDKVPAPEKKFHGPLDMNITWLLQQLDEKLNLSFIIDRQDERCYTPRRNPKTNELYKFANCQFNWGSSVNAYFSKLFTLTNNLKVDISSANADSIFVPVVPLVEPDATPFASEKSGSVVHIQTSDEGKESTLILPDEDVNLFLLEQKKSLQAKLNSLGSVFPSKGCPCFSDVTIVVILEHCKRICQAFGDGIDFIENMLRQQLITAIGKEIGAKEFDEYMRYHYRKLFKAEFSPKPFSYAIRRPDHYPEGLISIESQNGEDPYEVVYSIVRKLEDVRTMKFAIDSSTSIRFGGDRYIHSWVSHKFSNDTSAKLKLIARARQFSSFILMIGNVISADEFQPRQAILVQNKDDLLIPMLTEVIPTPKAFKKSIESLSQTQRAFAKAFRAMQLESTLFSLCVIQIKPQMEKLLRLPDDSLTKEIRLTQDLMNLFIEYQIPSDLLSYEPEEGITHTDEQKIAFVKKQVTAMKDMIADTKKKELEDLRQQQEYEQKTEHIEVKNEVLLACCLIPDSDSDISESDGSEESGCYKESDCSDYDKCKIVAQEESKEEESKEEESKEEEEEKKEEEQEEKKEEKKEYENNKNASGSPLLDFTKLPATLNKNFDALDKDEALHATILKTGGDWTKKFQKAILAKPDSATLGIKAQESENKKAFDLLDALTRSGALLVDAASFHVVVASTHCFDRTLINTVIEKNANPIEMVECSALIIAATIHEESPEEMLQADQLQRVKESSSSSHLFQ